MDKKPIEVASASSKATTSETPPTLTVQNGKVSVVNFSLKITSAAEGKNYELWCGDKKWPWILNLEKKTGHAFIAVDYFTKNKSETLLPKDKNVCALKKINDASQGGEVVAHLKYAAFPYLEEKLKVSPKKVFPSAKDLKRIEHEQQVMAEIYAQSNKDFYFQSPFITPLDSVLTSIYGNQRIFNNKKRSQHLGNDYRASVGTPIPATNRGKVVYVGNMFYSGNQVVVDHGGDIFSIYAHLSEIKVKVDQMVDKGDVLGLSGATGRVSGPHLHWGVKLGGMLVDGVSLVESSNKAL